jgi:hypothetical protein
MSCQKQTSRTDQDTINDAIADLDEGRAQDVIDKLTPIASYNKTGRLMSLLAAAYLYRAQVSTKEIIDLFLSFSVQAEIHHDSDDEKLKDFTHLVAALDHFFQKLALVPSIQLKDQETDLNNALFFLKSAEPATPSVALQKGLIRLILAKYYFRLSIQSLLMPNEQQKCTWNWITFHSHFHTLLQTSEDLVGDLIDADPKKIEIWKRSRESIKDTRSKLESTKVKEFKLDPAVQELFIYFLKSHSVKIGCDS